MTLPMARELANFGVRVMSIAPGPFGMLWCLVDTISKYLTTFLLAFINRDAFGARRT